MNNFLKMVAEQGCLVRSGEQIGCGVPVSGSAGDIFGADSYLVDGSAWIEPIAGGLLTNTALFQCVVLALMLSFLLLLFRQPELVRFIFGRVLSPDTTHSERLYDDRSAATNSHFFSSILFVGVLFATVFCVKLVDVVLPEWIAEVLPEGVASVAAPAMAIALAAIVLLQLLLLRATGSITLSQPLISALVYVKELYFAFALFFISPAMILYALCPPGEGRVWLTVIVLQVLCTIILFLRETFLLFISKKVSILHWILYLCAVEMFPTTLLSLLAVKMLM